MFLPRQRYFRFAWWIWPHIRHFCKFYLSVHTEGTQTDDPLFNGLDDTINRLYQELSSHQHRLDSIEANRLEMVNFNRLLSFLPKPNLPKEEEDFTHQDSADPYDGSWGENRIQYPAV